MLPSFTSVGGKNNVEAFSESLKQAAPDLGAHGLSREAFSQSGLLEGAIERLRGQQAATMTEKRIFVAAILDHLKDKGRILRWNGSGSRDRHDYEILLPDGRNAIVEAKGCLDGQNTNIFIRPPQADEFVIWSLCQNAAGDPRHNVWSGIHTRLGAEMMHRHQQVDGLVVWDMLCGTIARPCPKLERDPNRATSVGRYRVPPPCIYLFPRKIPDPRNNPNPEVFKIRQVEILNALHKEFQGNSADLTAVHITADMDGPTPTRVTKLVREGRTIIESKPTSIKRAR